MIKRLLPFILLITCITEAYCQGLPIGGWRDCLPYRFAIKVIQGTGKIYCVTSANIFSITTSDNSIQKYSKANGLSDIGISTAAYSNALHALLIAYSNSNIDLLYDNGQVTNISAIKSANIIGDRNIYSIYATGSTAYLACGFGIVNVNLSTQLINETYYIGPNGTSLKVNQVSILADTIYAATANGVYYASLSDSEVFANYQVWKLFGFTANGLGACSTSFVQSFNNRMYAVQSDSLFELKNNAWSYIYFKTNLHINGITSSASHLVMAEDSGNINSSKIVLVDGSNTVSSVYPPGLGYAKHALEDNNGVLWLADNYNGLLHYQNGNTQNLTPNSPYTAGDIGVSAYNGNVYVAPANATVGGNSDGFFIRSNNVWANYKPGVNDISVVLAGPTDASAYFGTFTNGLIHFLSNNTFTVFNSSNSTLLPLFGTDVVASGMAFDNENNLWVSNYGGLPSPLSVYKTDGTWQRFTPNVSVGLGYFNHIAVDQLDQKWLVNALGGLLVVNNGADLTTTNDDLYKTLGTGVGNGNLPSSTVYCLAVDQLGNVWVGTNQGITVFYCPGDIFTSSGCDAQQIIYSSAAGNGYLLGTDNVTAIVVDGANRKWVGTNTGVYLLSADGSKQLENFTTSNSPLFSNNIVSLALDPITGDLFIGTDLGLLEYRTTASAGSTTDCNVTVFPDPVRETYTGPITIGGVVANATVKITDITGALIYQTTALGGQAIWDGNTLKGVRAKTGVYLVFVSNSDGTVTCTGKFLLVN